MRILQRNPRLPHPPVTFNDLVCNVLHACQVIIDIRVTLPALPEILETPGDPRPREENRKENPQVGLHRWAISPM
ncbi:V-Type Proton Atpase Subunit S1 [Manis pentadactyla]|nr:V-Type Proton Atpase Subunit S1 [Manis pentadactyla]